MKTYLTLIILLFCSYSMLMAQSLTDAVNNRIQEDTDKISQESQQLSVIRGQESVIENDILSMQDEIQSYNSLIQPAQEEDNKIGKVNIIPSQVSEEVSN